MTLRFRYVIVIVGLVIIGIAVAFYVRRYDVTKSKGLSTSSLPLVPEGSYDRYVSTAITLFSEGKLYEARSLLKTFKDLGSPLGKNDGACSRDIELAHIEAAVDCLSRKQLAS